MVYGDVIQFKKAEITIAEVVKMQFEQLLHTIESAGLSITDGKIEFKHTVIRDPNCDMAIGWTFETKD